MAQQISMERALEAAQARIGKLTWENVLLEAHALELEAELVQLREQQTAPFPPPGVPERQSDSG